MPSYLDQKHARMVLSNRGFTEGGAKNTPNKGVPKYGQPSVMDKFRKTPMPELEREFRQGGGIEMLATRARGITQPQWKIHNPPDNDYADSGYQAAATVYKKTLDPSSQKNIDRDVGREVINQRSAQMHMGSPSNYKARRDRKMFGSTMLTMPKTVQRKK